MRHQLEMYPPVGVHVGVEDLLLVVRMKARLLDVRGYAPQLDVVGGTPSAVTHTVALYALLGIIRIDVMQSGQSFGRLP